MFQNHEKGKNQLELNSGYVDKSREEILLLTGGFLKWRGFRPCDIFVDETKIKIPTGYGYFALVIFLGIHKKETEQFQMKFHHYADIL